MTYIISAICAVSLFYLAPDNEYMYMTKYAPLFYLLLVILIVADGFKNFKFKPERLSCYDHKIIKTAEWVSWIFVPVILILIFNDINVLRSVDLATYRLEGDWYGTGLLKGGIFLSLCIYISELFFVPQFFFFYLLSKKEVSKGLKLRLFVASFSFVFMTLLFAGRDGIVYWVMNALIFYLLLKNIYTTEIQKILKKGAVVVVSILAVPMLAISAARFFLTGSLSISEIVTPFVDYGGQAPHVFCQSFYINSEDISGYDIKNMSDFAKQSLGLYLGWTFGTFVKSLVWSFGPWGGLAVAFVLNILSRITVIMNNHKHDIWSFFLLVMLFQIPFWGVFYYRQAMNNMYLVNLVFAVVCIFMFTRQRNQV